MNVPCRETGYLLLPIVALLTVVAIVSFWINHQGAQAVNNVTRETDTAIAQYVTEAGLSHALWRINQADCATYSDTNEAFGSHSYSVAISPTDGSPISVAATGTLANGASAAQNLSNLTVYSSSVTNSLELQPGPEGEDTFIWDGAHQDTNFGAANRLELNNASAERNILIRFDLSTLPSNVQFISATLSLYLQGGSDLANGVIDAHRVTRSWYEGVDDDVAPPTAPGATYRKRDGTSFFGWWFSAGGDYDPTPLATTTIATLTPGWYQWDVTDGIKGGPQSALASNGLLLTASGGNVDKIEFTSSDGDPTFAPKLGVVFGCECGQPCSVSIADTVLMVVEDPANLSPKDTIRKGLIESWGYQVNMIDDSDTQGNYDTELAGSNVVFVSETVVSTEVGTKLLDATVGVVSEEGALVDEFGIAGSAVAVNATGIYIADNTHYITSLFPIGSLTIASASVQFVEIIDTAPGLEILGDGSFYPTFSAIDTDSALFPVGTAAGRRVQLPWGNSPFDFSVLNSKAHTLLKRSLEWAAGNEKAGYVRDDFNTLTFDGNDGTQDWAGDWQEVGADELASGAGPSTGRIQVVSNLFTGNGNQLRLGLAGGSLSDSGIQREADISQLTTAFLTFQRRIDGRDDGNSTATVTLEISSDGGSSWNTLHVYTLDWSDSSTVDESFDITAYISTNTQIRLIGSGTTQASGDYLYVDAVRIDAVVGSSGGGRSGMYVESYEEWSATQTDQWQVQDLSSFGVPSDAVVEVAVLNTNTNTRRWGGVRAVGSSLNRRFELHEPEGGGEDVVVMHAQTNGNSEIEHYSDDTNDVSFALLGYWTNATYVETFTTFSAGGSNSWIDHDLAPYGVGADQIAEVVIANTSTSRERVAGVRSNGSALNRYFDIHEAESGGVDTVTMLVNADSSANATVEVRTESDSDVDFYLVGYWTTPPGSYTESSGTEVDPSSSSSVWTPWDLSAEGVPANSVVQLALLNHYTSQQANLGAREPGNPEDRRWLRLQEAESGGADVAVWHVIADSTSTIEFYDEDTSVDHLFHVLGWWQ